MKQFDITVPNQMELSNVCDMLAKSAINIKAISTNSNKLLVVTEDDSTTRDVLRRANYNFSEDEILSLRLIDRPGELAKIVRLLNKLKIGIDSIYIVGKIPERGETELAIKVNDIAKAKKNLS